MKNIDKESFWITNISNMDVGLSDLNLTIRAFTSINILDKKHYSLTKEQINKSLENGSLNKRKDKVFVRKISPEIDKPHRITTAQSMIQTKKRSGIEVVPIKYEELDIPDTVYADENSDLVEADRQPILKK